MVRREIRQNGQDVNFKQATVNVNGTLRSDYYN